MEGELKDANLVEESGALDGVAASNEEPSSVGNESRHADGDSFDNVLVGRQKTWRKWFASFVGKEK